jgi:Bacterial extracellular solute-binding proteins, family 3
MVTRDGDSKFSDFVNHILQSLMTAEEMGLSGTVVASDLKTTDIFGTRYEAMFQDAFQVVGDYSQLYKKHLESLVPRSPANEINLGNTAGMFSKPFGTLRSNNLSPGLTSPTVEEIFQRGYLVVGIIGAPIFAELVNGEYHGMDVDFAKALSAALFDGIISKVRYVLVSSQERFQKLKDGEVDFLARATTITMERDVKEPTTGHGFTFSTPMFHSSVRLVGPST